MASGDKEKERMNRFFEARRQWLDGLAPFIRPGRIIDLGCGGGFVIEFYLRHFPDSIMFGIENLLDRLQRASVRNNPNVHLVNGDIVSMPFRKNAFDTVSFIYCLHVIFSLQGRDAVMTAFDHAFNILKENGRLIIQDFHKPEPQQVRLVLKTDMARTKFIAFTDQFRPRKISYTMDGDHIVTDIANAIDFLAAYRAKSEDDWHEFMIETPFFLTESEIFDALTQIGFTIEDVKRIPPPVPADLDGLDDIEFDFELGRKWIQVIASKTI